MAEEAVRISFPAKPEYLLLARLAVAEVSRALPLAEREITDLKLAVTEACGNAIRHAYSAETGGEVELELVPGHGRLDVIVVDRGDGIELPVRMSRMDPKETGGMGLPIIRAVVDELDVKRGPGGRGTIVRMTKRTADRRHACRGDPTRV